MSYNLTNLVNKSKTITPYTNRVIVSENYMKTEKIISDDGILIYGNSSNIIINSDPNIKSGGTGPIIQLYGAGGKDAKVGINFDTFNSGVYVDGGRTMGRNPATQILAIDNGMYSSDLVFYTAPESLTNSNLPESIERIRIKSNGTTVFSYPMEFIGPIDSTVTINGNIVANSNLTVNGNILTHSDLTVDGNIKGKSNLNILGNASINGDIYGNSNLVIEDNIYGNNEMYIGGTAVFDSNVLMKGNVIIEGNLTVNTQSFSVTGPAIFQSTIDVLGTAWFHSDVIMYEDLSVDGTLTVGGTSYFSTVETSGVINNMTVDGFINDNTKVGNNALVLLNTGSKNTALGSQAGSTQTSGNENTYIGYDTGGNIGNSNTFVGSYSGIDNIGNFNTAIGYNTSNSNPYNYTTSIGYNSVPQSNNEIILNA
jgi:cytoskeletal protein CcmA (bactofilin family)